MFRKAANSNAENGLRGFEGLEDRQLFASDLFATDVLTPVSFGDVTVNGSLGNDPLFQQVSNDFNRTTSFVFDGDFDHGSWD